MTKKTKRKKYAGGYYWRTEAGKWRAEVSRDYKKYRQTFAREAQAQGWIESTVLNLDRENKPLTATEMIEARRALDILPDGASLIEAARMYAEYTNTSIAEIDTKEAIDIFMREKEAAGLRPKSLSSQRSYLLGIQATHGNSPVHTITTNHLITWLDDKGISGTTRDNYRRSWRVFFRWCVASNHAKLCPTDGITPVRKDSKLASTITPAQAQKLLHTAAATDPAIVPYIALGLFAGVRSAELSRLTGEEITDEHIHISGKAAKTRQQRFITITPNLAEWLRAHPPEGKIQLTNHKERFRRVKEQADLIPWPTNVMRHSFASYHLALYQDAPRTAHEMGHANADMIYRNYRNLVTKSEAKSYFAITP